MPTSNSVTHPPDRATGTRPDSARDISWWTQEAAGGLQIALDVVAGAVRRPGRACIIRTSVVNGTTCFRTRRPAAQVHRRSAMPPSPRQEDARCRPTSSISGEGCSVPGKTEVVHRIQRATSRSARSSDAADRDRQIDGCACARSRSKAGAPSTGESMGGWIELAVGRKGVHPAKRHRLAWCHALGLVGARRYASTTVDRRGRNREIHRPHDRLVHAEDKRIVGPVHRAIATDPRE